MSKYRQSRSYDEFLDALRDACEEERRRRGLSQRELGEAIKYRQTMVSAALLPFPRRPAARCLFEMANYFGLKVTIHAPVNS